MENVHSAEVKVDTSFAGLTTDAANATFISRGNENRPVDTSLVKVRIGYPKDWEGPKFMKDGDVKEVSKEVAERFVNQKIAKIIK